MIPDSDIELIKKFLAQDMPHRKIAEEVGVSRGIVSAVAQGKRQLRGVCDNRPSGINEKQRIVPPYQCSGCDNSVTTVPCLVCQARSYKKSQKLGGVSDL